MSGHSKWVVKAQEPKSGTLVNQGTLGVPQKGRVLWPCTVMEIFSQTLCSKGINYSGCPERISVSMLLVNQ